MPSEKNENQSIFDDIIRKKLVA